MKTRNLILWAILGNSTGSLIGCIIIKVYWLAAINFLIGLIAIALLTHPELQPPKKDKDEKQ